MNVYLDQLICRLERINHQLKALESALTLACLDDVGQGESACVESNRVCGSPRR